jgi:hypothetical protein
VSKEESAENIRFQVCNIEYIRMGNPEKLWHTLRKLVLRWLNSSKKSRIPVSVAERDCIHNTLYYTSNKRNSQQPFPLSTIATASAKQPHGLLAKGKSCPR